jgi:hypothetical protein
MIISQEGVSMIRTQVRLTEAQAQALNASTAARQGVDHLIQQSASIDLVERRRRAIAAAGRFHSGRPDVAARHDDYLAEAYQG